LYIYININTRAEKDRNELSWAELKCRFSCVARTIHGERTDCSYSW